MPQFAVYRNPGRNPAMPFIVQVQTTRLDRTATRVMMPLLVPTNATGSDHPMWPYIVVLNRKLVANPLDITMVPLARLGEILMILPEPDQDRIIRAIDEMISRA